MQKTQHGTAIIVALLVVAIVAAMATAMMTRIRIDTQRTTLLLNDTKASFLAAGSIAWAIDALNTNWKNRQNNHVIDLLPLTSINDQKDGATISSVVTDAQGYFNLNNLTDPTAQAYFIKLLKITNPNIDDNLAHTITQGVTDWITTGKSDSMFDIDYSKNNPPYRAPHHFMAHASEIRLVKGMNPQIYRQLIPFVIALPGNSKINVNTASPQVLMSISKNMTLAAAHQLAQTCRDQPFPTLEAFNKFDIARNASLSPDMITVNSDFFLVRTDITLGNQHLVLYTLLQRKTKDASANTLALWQSKGTL